MSNVSVTIKVKDRFGQEHLVRQRNVNNKARILLPIYNKKDEIIGSLHRENMIQPLALDK